MADIVHTRQQIRIKIRLEMRFKQFPAVNIQLILIRIDHVDLRITVDRLHTLKQRIRRQRVVVIGQNDEIALRHIDGSVGISRDSLIFTQNHVADSLVLHGIPLKHALRALASGASVRHADLPVLIGLCP